MLNGYAYGGRAAPRREPEDVAMIVECSSCAKPNRFPASRLNERARCAACKAELLPLRRPVHVGSEAELDELVAHSSIPLLVDFWAAWCGPCRSVAPELEKLARERAGAVAVGKVDTEEVPELARRFGIQSIPTMVLFRGGHEAARVSGAMPASAIAARLAL